jgi:hypothetical protein
MTRPLRPQDDDTDRDKPRNKRRYDGKEKRPDGPDREPDRTMTRSRSKESGDWDEEELADLDDDDLDLEDDEEDWGDVEEDEDDWEEAPGFDDDDDDR